LLSGTFWVSGGQFLTMIITFVANIFLARILGPEEFGKIGLIMFFITVSSVLIEGGLGGALVRKKEVTKEDYSTVFVFNLGISVFLFLLFVAISKNLGEYYGDKELGVILIFSNTIIIINAFQVTQNAKLIREMKFKERSLFRLLSVFLGSVVGVTSAIFGFGVWSLVLLQISSALFLLFFYVYFEKFFVSPSFHLKSFKELYGFGINTTLVSFINTVFDNLYQIILATYFSLSKVGFYYQAKKLQDVPNTVVNVFTQNVLFSSMAKIQDDKEKFKVYFLRIQIFIISFLGMITMVIFTYSEQLILVIFGEKWLESAFFMKILTWASLFFYAETINKVIFKVYDKTKQLLYLEIFKKVLLSVFILAGVYQLDINILLYGLVISNVLSYASNIVWTNKIIDQGILENFKIIIKVVVSALLSYYIIYFLIDYLKLNEYFSFLTVPLLLIIYFILLKVFRVIDIYSEIRYLLKIFWSK
jgi:O-antigen/teichoic acid export membrane protein